MIHSEWLRPDEVLMIRPEGEIDDDDFERLAERIDPVIAAKGRLEGLMVDARGFAGWDDAEALRAHLRFVHARAAKVARVAVVGDQWWLRAAAMMEPLYGTPLRNFAAAEFDAARAWLLETPAEPAAVTLLPGSRDNVVGIRIAGRLRDDDYERLRSDLLAQLPENGKIRLLVLVDESFRGWTPKAAFEDFSMLFSPWRQRFEKLAIVAGPGLVRWFADNMPTGLLPYPMKAFAPEEAEAAWAWIRA